MDKELRVGDGFDDGVTQGPLINQAAVDKVCNRIKNYKKDNTMCSEALISVHSVIY